MRAGCSELWGGGGEELLRARGARGEGLVNAVRDCVGTRELGTLLSSRPLLEEAYKDFDEMGVIAEAAFARSEIAKLPGGFREPKKGGGGGKRKKSMRAPKRAH